MATALSTIQATYGGSNPISMSEYYKGGSYIGSGYTYKNYSIRLGGMYPGSVPASGAISLSQLTSPVKPSVWANGSGTPLKTPYGSNVYSSWWSLANVLPANLRDSGSTVYLCFYTGNSGWARYPHTTSTISIGTAKTFRTAVNGDKTFNGQLEYDGGSNIRLRGWYSGPSTNSPNGQVYLQGVGGVA